MGQSSSNDDPRYSPPLPIVSQSNAAATANQNSTHTGPTIVRTNAASLSSPSSSPPIDSVHEFSMSITDRPITSQSHPDDPSSSLPPPPHAISSSPVSSPAADHLLSPPTTSPSLPPQSLSERVKYLMDPDTAAPVIDSSSVSSSRPAAPPSPHSHYSSSSTPSSSDRGFSVPGLFPPPKIETVPTAFKWIHGGSEVFVTGSFNNWQGKILMYRNEDGEFSLIIDIPPGTHHYKYIVDQEWMLDEEANTVEVNGVINNVVEVKRPVFEYTQSGFDDSDEEDVGGGGGGGGGPNSNSSDEKKRTLYGQRAPGSADYVHEPPKLPPHLTEILLNQTKPIDPNMLPVPPHVILNHLYIMNNQQSHIPNTNHSAASLVSPSSFSSSSPSPTPSPSSDYLFVTGITQRFKPNSHTKITHKFVTTVYYAPKPNAQDIARFTVPMQNTTHR